MRCARDGVFFYVVMWMAGFLGNLDFWLLGGLLIGLGGVGGLFELGVEGVEDVAVERLDDGGSAGVIDRDTVRTIGTLRGWVVLLGISRELLLPIGAACRV